MRQLSFAFLRSERQITELASHADAPLQPAALRRIDPARNMARFYSLGVERDLFGRVVLVRRWGRIGTAGKIQLDEHAGEGEALAALTALKMAKQRKGYRAIT
jgi:predicted DNA-binding WGR domain protein